MFSPAESLVGVTYMLQVPEDTLCWLKQPVIIDKTYKYRGQEKRKKFFQILLKPQLHSRRWQKV